MRVALDAARNSIASGDIPVGAAIFNNKGEVVAIGHNERELHNDPTAHAEIVAIRRAAEKLGDWHLTDHTLVVTLEPCAMCAGAMVLARLPRLVYATTDPKAGAGGSIMDITQHPALNHQVDVSHGLFADEASEQIRSFFRMLRARGEK